MVIYLDQVAVLNFLVDGLLLYGTARLGAAAIRWRRLLLAAALGAAYAVAVYLPGLAFLQSLLCKLAVGTVMLLTAFGIKRSTLRLGAVFAALTLALCGAVYAAELLRHGRFFYRENQLFFPVSFFSLLLTALAVSLACRLLLPRLNHAPDSVLPLEIELRGKKISLTALRDSGNTLTDPITGAPVLTAYAGAVLPLFPKELDLKTTDFRSPIALMERLRAFSPRLIPYRAVGISNGLLLTINCHITINNRTSSMPLALTPTPLSDGGAYDVLIGGM